MKTALLPQEMKTAFFKSDSSYDGIFFAAVRTTGIFCRPSCSARKPLPENVEFFIAANDAISAGYRPCQRCRPLDPGKPPDWLEPVLKKLAISPAERITATGIRDLGLNPVRVRRYFLKNYGMSFHAFCRHRRLGNSLSKIKEGGDLDDVGLDHGYESSSGFREAFGKLFGAPPGASRHGRSVIVSWMESPLGPLVAGALDEGICFLEFSAPNRLKTQLDALRKKLEVPILPGDHPHLQKLKTQLFQYFQGTLKEWTVPIVVRGSSFQEKVWQALRAIPYSHTCSYEDIARSIGSAGAVRAVGRANGENRVAILIPCHRVINKSGELGGYGGGLWRKRFLLDLEKRSSLAQAMNQNRATNVDHLPKKSNIPRLN